ncbi:hypothetical protein B0J14DRAFT_114430 [Halenospora varia]|nr:hypothetical protein B0J14DRAFT_114430 [Halenospora varia]
MSTSEEDTSQMPPRKRQRTYSEAASSSVNYGLDEREPQEPNPTIEPRQSHHTYSQGGSTFSGTTSAGGNVNQFGNVGRDVHIHPASTIDDRRRFFDWLGPSIDADRDHNFIRRKRYLQTGDWILRGDKFQRWYENGSSELLWCWGAPGAGKSILA